MIGSHAASLKEQEDLSAVLYLVRRMRQEAG